MNGALGKSSISTPSPLFLIVILPLVITLSVTATSPVMEGEEEKKIDTAFTTLASVDSDPVKPQAVIKASDLDQAASLLARNSTLPAFTPEQNRKLLKKLDLHILPMMLALYLLQFLSKTSLGLSTLLNLKAETNLSQAEYNILSTIFYVSYLAFEFPQSLGLQRYPVGKYLAVNIFAWSVLILAHAACSDFTGLVIVRFLLGIAEGSVTPGFMIITSMYYTSEEQAARVGAWFLMNGSATVFGASIVYGLLCADANAAVASWKILYLIIGFICFGFAVVWLIYFPDSPVTAWFLTNEEKVASIRRIASNRSSGENKTFKKAQFIEAISDIKVWMFCLFSLFDNIPNIIYIALGFTKKTSALLNIPTGIIEIVTIGSSIFVLRLFPNNRGYVAFAYSLTQILGSALVLALPESNSIGKLISIYLTGAGTTSFVIALSWLQSSTAGHTKRITAQSMNLIAYCLGNIIGPQIWQQEFSPVNTVPWAIVLFCYSTLPILILLIRRELSSRNSARDILLLQGGEKSEAVVDVLQEDGSILQIKVDRFLLDETDRVNLDFRYVL